MSSSISWNVIGGSPVSYTLDVDKGSKPEATPKGLIVTRAVQTQAGWVGQVIIDKEIVYETEPIALTVQARGDDQAAEQAMVEVNSYVVNRFKALFRPEVE